MYEIEIIIKEIEEVLSKVEEKNINKFLQIINMSKRIFIIGEGRSGLVGKAFAMRLMHLGAAVYVVGETITPALQSEDVLIAVSGSGTTKNIVMAAEKAKELGCKILAVSTNSEAELGKLADFTLVLKAATKYRLAGEVKSAQPLGSLFDQCSHIIFDTICLRYAKLKNEDNNMAFNRHSNLE